MALIDFEPKLGIPPDLQSPQPDNPEWSPEWVVDTWRRLYQIAPSPTLGRVVENAQAWLKEQKGGS